MEIKSKSALMKDFQRHGKDSGSAEVQIALLTRRIERLTTHLKANAKDHNSRYGLIKMVSARRKLLDYLQRTEAQRYQSILERLQLRR